MVEKRNLALGSKAVVFLLNQKKKDYPMNFAIHVKILGVWNISRPT